VVTRYPEGWFSPEQILERYHAEQILAREQRAVGKIETNILPPPDNRALAELRARVERLEQIAQQRDGAVIRELGLTVKSVNGEMREIEGVATSKSIDHLGDEVEPRGALFELPLPLLLYHKSDSPVGQVAAADVTETGIKVRARIARIDEPGEAQSLCDKAWHSVRASLV
jgi:hypothetical protein